MPPGHHMMTPAGTPKRGRPNRRRLDSGKKKGKENYIQIKQQHYKQQ